MTLLMHHLRSMVYAADITLYLECSQQKLPYCPYRVMSLYVTRFDSIAKALMQSFNSVPNALCERLREVLGEKMQNLLHTPQEIWTILEALVDNALATGNLTLCV